MNIHFDLLAPIYDRVISQPDPQTLQRLLKLPTDGRLLEAGGGTGRISARLKPLVGQLVLGDLSGPMMRQAQAKGEFCPVMNLTENLPFPADSFERVLVVDALHHFTDQRRAIGEMLRVLKPGGRLVIEEPDIRRFAVKLVALAEKLTLMGSHFNSAAEIETILSTFGVETQIETDGGFAVWIIADKQKD